MGNPLAGAASGAAAGSVFGPWGTAIGAAGGALGSILNLGGGNQSAYTDEAMQRYRMLNPGVRAQDVAAAGPSAYNSVDPSTRAAMVGALRGLQNKYRQGGMDAVDRGKAAELQNEQTQRTRQNEAAVLQQARQSGTLNSGNALVGQLMGAQGAGAAASSAAVQQAAEAERARMGTLQGITSTAGQIQGGDFTRARANDAMTTFNKGLEVGNANRKLAADQYTSSNEQNRVNGMANLASGAPTNNTAAQAAGGLTQAGMSLAGNDWGSMFGGNGGGGNESGVDPNQEGVDPRGYGWGGGH